MKKIDKQLLFFLILIILLSLVYGFYYINNSGNSKNVKERIIKLNDPKENKYVIFENDIVVIKFGYQAFLDKLDELHKNWPEVNFYPSLAETIEKNQQTNLNMDDVIPRARLIFLRSFINEGDLILIDKKSNKKQDEIIVKTTTDYSNKYLYASSVERYYADPIFSKKPFIEFSVL